MRRTLFTAVGLALIATGAAAAEPWQSEYGRLLATYVKPGGVDYPAWHASEGDRTALRNVVDAIAAEGPQDTTREGRIAYHTNAYNAWVLHLVLENWPLQSVSDLAPNFGFFSNTGIRVAGNSMSLNTLEKELLLKEFQDPRIHFVINCASRSCPALLPEPLTASALDRQMDMATRAFLADPVIGVAPTQDGAVRISRIFDWYGRDFEATGGVRNFITRYRDEALDPNLEIRFLDYDWAINIAP